MDNFYLTELKLDNLKIRSKSEEKKPIDKIKLNKSENYQFNIIDFIIINIK